MNDQLTEEQELRIENFYRAGGECICEKCGEEYYSHPHYEPSALTTQERYPWLRELCNGDLVKL